MPITNTRSVVEPVVLVVLSRESPSPALGPRDPLKGLETLERRSNVARVSIKIEYYYMTKVESCSRCELTAAPNTYGKRQA